MNTLPAVGVDLREPMEFAVELPSGEVKTYIISKFPALAGREIVAKYPMSAIPKLGDYNVNQETMLKLMHFVAVPREGHSIEQSMRLSSMALVDNHVPDWETLAKLELQMLEYNCSFFANGKISTFLSDLTANMKQSVTEILTGFALSLSQRKEPL